MAVLFSRALEGMLKGSFISRSVSTADNGQMIALGFQFPRNHRDRCWPRRAGAVVGVLIALVCVLAPAAAANGKDDHERARAAVLAGDVLPLPIVLERLQRTHPGQVLEVELEREDGRWIYEVKLLQPGGQLVKLELDARTAEVLKMRRKDARASERSRR